jgi:hypothetical protein
MGLLSFCSELHMADPSGPQNVFEDISKSAAGVGKYQFSQVETPC